ncbi:hypothetical protein PM8797T_19969 [Gimesia maris DSM 8797]|uniref:Uncharacterized protein n=1 Tax=Gimesia maris TaxID=122 RepID=A0ABX5YT98_9PLAN|nr:hypothetical protein PM8797T_19969 [Gimesia maris DSM 8797]QEG18812.1 hypothetical protein GmarT_47050 [Gimesia maris]
MRRAGGIRADHHVIVQDRILIEELFHFVIFTTKARLSVSLDSPVNLLYLALFYYHEKHESKSGWWQCNKPKSILY